MLFPGPVSSNGTTSESNLSSIPNAFDALSITGSDGRPRIPFVFSSVKRALASKDDLAIQDYLTDVADVLTARGTDGGPTNTQTVQLLSEIFAQQQNSATLSDVFSSPVTMLINPSSFKVEMNKRVVKLDTLTGSVFVHFTDELGFDNDVMTFSFQGSTGTLVAPSGSSDDVVKACFLRRLSWLNLLALTAEEIYLTSAKVKNTKFATISTPALPIPAQFDGHFPSVMSFEENASDRSEATYSFQFVVKTVNNGGISPSQAFMSYLANQVG